MTLDILTDLPPVLQLHLWPAILALGLGPVALYRRRRDIWHKVAGYTWVSAMALVAGGSFWLEAAVLPIAYGYGPIHLLSIVVLVGLWRGVAAARAGDIARHRAEMRGLYWHALAIAGLFTLLPGRLLNAVFFGPRPELGYVAIGLIGAALVARALRGGRTRAANG
jgi:uncharacterized membrane protein